MKVLRETMARPRIFVRLLLLGSLAAICAAGGQSSATQPRSAAPQTNAESEIQSIRAQMSAAAPYFNSTWTAIFGTGKDVPQPPAINLYVGEKIKTPCGDILRGITLYCPRDNTIYFDAAFLARVDERVHQEATAGIESAAVATVAHEFGHLIWKNLVLKSTGDPDKRFVALFAAPLASAQDGKQDQAAFQERLKAITSNATYQEKLAECFAGATMLTMQKAGKLGDDQIHAAIASLRWATDSTDNLSDPATYDLHRDLHELYITDEYDEPYVVLGIADRSYYFSTGFSDGPAACSQHLTISW
jgi:predicted metalloprotease